MQITSTQSYLFRKEKREGEGENEKVNYVEKVFVEATKDPVVVADWIRDTRLFKLAVDDGSIKEVAVISKAPAKADAAKADAAKADAADTGLADDGKKQK